MDRDICYLMEGDMDLCVLLRSRAPDAEQHDEVHVEGTPGGMRDVCVDRLGKVHGHD